ncbi:MAG TPA: T9SS type A sorting domain-containing protein [Flavobacterium sp.]|jgi:uncharacterized repeat protein (TIGR01451 family)
MNNFPFLILFYLVGISTAAQQAEISNPIVSNIAVNFITPALSCGASFYDNGGSAANYANNSDVTTVICPNESNEVVTVTFSSFNVEPGYDGLYVFNGINVNAPQISTGTYGDEIPGGVSGAFWGTYKPGPFTSSSPDGCLTFRFRSDSSGNRPGWIAAVTCGPPPSCIVPSALHIISATANSISYGWTESNGAQQWQIIAIPCGSPAPGSSAAWNTVTTSPATINGLSPSTCYSFYVRAICGGSNVSLAAGPFYSETLMNPTCSDIFTDGGGASGNYSNNAESVTIICPNSAMSKVLVTFNSFGTQVGSDGLYVYDGASITSPQIASTNGAGSIPLLAPGAFWGNEIPGPFESTSADGCLTFKFVSNSSVTGTGWTANVTCSELCPKPTSLTASNITLNSVALSWIAPVGATSFGVIAVLCGGPMPTDSSSWIPTTSNSIVLTGLEVGMCYDLYVKASCSSSQSLVAGPRTISTLNVPPACGGNFFDSGGEFANYAINENSITTICPTNPEDVVTVTFTVFDTESNWDGLYVYNGNSTTAPQISSMNSGGNVPGGLPGSFWGTQIPGPFMSSSADGCLTFNFRSDGSVNRSGWIAEVECVPAIADTIILVAFFDENANGVMDINEVAFNQGVFSYQINNTVNNSAIYTTSGNYQIVVSDNSNTYTFSYQIYPELLEYFELAVSAVYNNIIIPSGTGSQTFYFPIQGLPVNDVGIAFASTGGLQPGQSFMNRIIYYNNGTSIASGTLSFSKDPKLTITSISQAETTATSNGFIYNFTDLDPLETRTIDVIMSVPTLPGVSLGEILSNSASISGPIGDININNNNSLLNSMVSGSYDPNDVIESHGPQIPISQFSSDDYLYYTIRFQNSGNADALIVRVENALDAQLNPESVRMLTSSHNYVMTQNGNQLTWQFDNINLPPQSQNNLGSNGYILYKVKPAAGYAVGDIIPNTANIFFDFNPAIVTNTFNTEFVNALAVPNFLGSEMTVYPNPANSAVNVSMRSSADLIQTILITDLLGKQIIDTQVNASDATIDVSSLSKGLYIIQINTDSNNRQVRKLIIN